MARVSVIIPAYNREKLLPETLESLSRQTFQDWCAIVVDDHSTDSTYEVAQEFAKKDARFVSLRRQGDIRGASVCRNQGARAAKSSYIVFLDSDDLLMPGALETRVREADAAPENDFIIFMTRLFAESPGDSALIWNRFSDQDDLERFLSMDLVWTISGPIWRSESFKKLGGFDESLVSFQDWCLHINALIAGLRFQRIPVVDHLYRRPPWTTDQISSQSSRKAAHMRSHRPAIRKIVELIRREPTLYPRLARQCLALYWWLAERNRQIGERAEALSIWREAGEIGLCNRFHRFLGEQILDRFDSRIGRYLLVFCEKAFRPIYAGMGSSTFHPVASDAMPLVKPE